MLDIIESSLHSFVGVLVDIFRYLSLKNYHYLILAAIPISALFIFFDLKDSNESRVLAKGGIAYWFYYFLLQGPFTLWLIKWVILFCFSVVVKFSSFFGFVFLFLLFCFCLLVFFFSLIKLTSLHRKYKLRSALIRLDSPGNIAENNSDAKPFLIKKILDTCHTTGNRRDHDTYFSEELTVLFPINVVICILSHNHVSDYTLREASNGKYSYGNSYGNWKITEHNGCPAILVERKYGSDEFQPADGGGLKIIGRARIIISRYSSDLFEVRYIKSSTATYEAG